MGMDLGHHLHCRFCGKTVVRLPLDEIPIGGEAVHSACLDVALALVDGEHAHRFAAKGVRRRGTSALSIGTSDTEILWACEDCGAYEVETVPGVWTKEQLGLNDAVDADRRAVVPANFPSVTAGAVAMSKTAVRMAAKAQEDEQDRAREAAHGGPGPVEDPAQ